MGITKNSPRETILEEYKRVLIENKRLREKVNHTVGKKDKTIARQRRRVDDLRLQLNREKRRRWGKEKHIERLRNKIPTHIARGRAEGFDKAMNKITHRDFRMISFSRVMSFIDGLCGAVNLNKNDIALLMWVGGFDFFNKVDFDKEMGDTHIRYESGKNKLVTREMVTEIAVHQNRKVYAITEKGREVYNKIFKFVENQYGRI
jgi:hypothetical protein